VSQSRVAVVVARGQFRNSEEEERSPLETVTRRVLKIVTDEYSVCLYDCVYVCSSDL
jgi:hypothetical protein